MNKEHFLILLKMNLRGLSEKDLHSVLQEYSEQFDTGVAEGKTEEQISKTLGNPKTIAKEILDVYQVERPIEAPTFRKGDWAEFEMGGRPQQDYTYENEQPYEPPYQHAAPPKPRRSAIGSFFMAILFIFLNILVFAFPILPFGITIFAFLLVGIALSVAPIFAIFSGALTMGLFPIFSLIAMFGIGIIMAVLAGILATGFCKLVARYAKWCARAIRGGEVR